MPFVAAYNRYHQSHVSNKLLVFSECVFLFFFCLFVFVLFCFLFFFVFFFCFVLFFFLFFCCFFVSKSSRESTFMFHCFADTA